MVLNANSKKDLEDFKSYILVEKNFSQHTAKAYYADILAYLIWLGDNQCEDVSFSKVREYLHFMQIFNYKKTTVARKIASIRTFYKYLHRERKVESNPAESLISPKRPKSLPKFLTTDEVEQILSNINIDTPAGYRNRAILELLWASGMRVSELTGLNKRDVNFETGEVKVYGKGAKERICFLTGRAKIHLKWYLESRVDDNEALFVTSKKPYTRITKNGVEYALKELGKSSGLSVTERVFPHKFRATLATNMLNKGADIADIQRILGHQSCDTTLQCYAKMEKDTIKKAHNTYIR